MGAARKSLRRKSVHPLTTFTKWNGSNLEQRGTLTERGVACLRVGSPQEKRRSKPTGEKGNLQKKQGGQTRQAQSAPKSLNGFISKDVMSAREGKGGRGGKGIEMKDLS